MAFLTYLCAFAFVLFIWWVILGKMGFSGTLRLGLTFLTLVPGFGLLGELIYLAFWDWPIHDDMEQLRKGLQRR